MSFFSSLVNTEPLLGVDIGTASIKIAEVKTGEKGPEILNYGILETLSYLERFNEAFQASTLRISEGNVAKYLKLLIERAGIRARNVVATVPAFLAFSTLIEVPPMGDGEIKKFLDYQAKQYIPLPLSTVSFDWVKVGERKLPSGEDRYQILLISIPNDQLQEFQNIFKAAGLRLKAVELEGMSLAKSLTDRSQELSLIMDIGSRSTGFAVAKNGFLKFSGQTDFSGGSLTQAISNGLAISERRAEDLKRQRGILGSLSERELSTLIQPLLDVIISEGKRVAQNYETNFGEKIQRVILSGGGANMAGIEKYVTDQFKVPAVKADPFANVRHPESLNPILKEIGPLLSVAIGSGLKSF
jgi:type IV pilus assembly protein PilM